MDYSSSGSDAENTALLRHLAAMQKKELRHARFISVVSLAALAFLIVVTVLLAPRVLNLLGHAERSLENIDVLAADATALISGSANTVKAAETLVQEANTLLAENTQDVADALDKINSVDFKRLNDAIDGFAAAVEPLAKVGRLFG